MPANIDKMMYVGKEPWHGLGTYVGDKEVTSAVALKEAGLDWEVEKKPSFYQKADGTYAPNGSFDIIRKDTDVTLGQVGRVYKPFQNKQAFEFMDAIIGGGRAAYHTAGSLGKGERVWILVKINDTQAIT